jgi:hypothetical protein
VHYLAVWHLERNSFQQARKYFGHLATLEQNEANVWLCLSVCCAMADELDESSVALARAVSIASKSDSDIRIKFCTALLAEKRRDFQLALEGYSECLAECRDDPDTDGAEDQGQATDKPVAIGFLKDLKGELMLRIAVLRKEMGLVDLSMQMCNSITSEPYSDVIRANALCLKVSFDIYIYIYIYILDIYLCFLICMLFVMLFCLVLLCHLFYANAMLE